MRNKIKTGSKFALNNEQGFTVIEILIALLIIILVMGIAISNPFSNSKDLDQQTEELERAVRFMGDEAVLRNAVIRLHFLLSNNPQEFAIEYGPSDSFILPPESEFETTAQTKEELEKEQATTKEINLKFNKVREFQESNYEIKDSVRIVGVGSSTSKRFKTEGDVSIYTFPTGEKDEAIIILGTEEALVSIEILPFSQKVVRTTHKLEYLETNDPAEVQDKKAKEIFETWSRNAK